MAVKDRVEGILRHLHADERQSAYAILDGASIPDLLDLLEEYQPKHTCLFSGNLDPEVEMTAPYLVHLQPGSEFDRHVIEHGWGHHWGIFATVPKEQPFIAVRKHFRTFLRVRGPEGDPLLFRYYDPRVLRVYLPTCNEDETGVIFGPVTSYLLEDEDPSQALRFLPDRAGEEGSPLTLGSGAQ
jgi:hypothetical protein